MTSNSSDNGKLTVHGTPVVGGIAYGPAAWTQRPPLPPAQASDLPEHERQPAIDNFDAAAEAVANSLLERASAAEDHAAELLTMTAGLAQDPGWRREIVKKIEQGIPAAQATMAATDRFIRLFEKAGGLMAERTTDLRDVRDRVLARMEGRPEPGIPVRDYPVVLLGDDLSPADTAGMDVKDYVAIVTQGGGPTSHTSIIARQLGIPCIVAARDLGSIPEGAQVLVDGSIGTVETGIPAEEGERLVEEDRRRLDLIRQWEGPGITKDGHPVQLLANVQDGDSARVAAEGQAEGVGLFRTELLFLDSTEEPSVDEQVADYDQVFAAFADKKVVVRTLDAGSDKPVPFATLSEEFNPALGVRGIRVTGNNPGILDHQLDAIERAAAGQPGTEVAVMAPMIATIPETRWFADLCRQRDLVPGVMVEVPAAVIQIEKILQIVDFVSIGTNDLTQYTMAADRMSPHLAEYTDPWQPAVLDLIARTAYAGAHEEVPVGICGEAAADPILACVLTGMGVTSLSMASGAIPAVGAQLAQVSFAQCEAAAVAALNADDAAAARRGARLALGMDG